MSTSWAIVVTTALFGVCALFVMLGVKLDHLRRRIEDLERAVHTH